MKRMLSLIAAALIATLGAGANPKSSGLKRDLVHFKYMWDNKIVPPFNFNKQQSLDSIERVVKLLAEHKAQLWIGHDKDITAKINRAPKFYE